ncbi:MAG: GNAT family N-acetyltransferase [Geodermatophilaceae bacterium]|nr:GNAT family N-acetyltransferase [Geodermatophilaceae bacterium]
MIPGTEPTALYPPGWEADVVAADGGTVHLRPIVPGDAAGLSALVARSSERTRYLRFFGPYPRIPERELHRFVNVDHHDRVAFVLQLGHEIIAVGRYERLDDDPAGESVAEVAFLVEDAHQGRGLGSILLEHLAAAGNERGIRRFNAEVLAENGQMVRIFLHAGYSATRSYDQGVVHLDFPIEPNDIAVAVAYEREQRAESRSIGRLLNPSSVAVIGASNDRAKVGHAVLRNLLDYGFEGPIYPINPDARHVAGVPAHPSVLDVPDVVDLAILTVPPAVVGEVMEQCRAKGVRGLVVVTGDIRGSEGTGGTAEFVAAARGQGMRVIGPNCLGVVNTDPAVRLNASLAPRLPGRGRVGFFCQSGALGVAILESALSRGLGLSTFVSAGNRADVSGNDLLQFWATDPATEVVLLHLESFGNPRKFARLARRLARDKPVVAVKSGRHLGVGTVAALAAHSVELPDQSVQALFESAGVIRVETVAQMFDVATLLAHQPLPTGPRVAVVGNSSALALLVADACAARGLEMAGPPVDVGPEGAADSFADAIHGVVAGTTFTSGVDALVVLFVPPLVTPGAEVARVLAEQTAGWDRPVVTTFLGSEGVPAQLQRRDGDEVVRGSIPSYPSPERAVLALAHALGYAQWRARPTGTVPDLPDADPGRARTVVTGALTDTPAGRPLTSEECADLLGAYGIAVLPAHRAATREEALSAAQRLGYPVVLKSTRRELRHRTDLGGVRLDLSDAAGLGAAYDAMRAEVAGTFEVLVQAMARPGVPVVVGVIDDPSFGALVSFGVAGVATELLGDRSYRALPVTDVDAAALLRAVRAWPLLAGYRGADPVDDGALADLVVRVGRLADDLPEVLSLELEPVVVSRSGVTVAGVSVRVGPPNSRLPSGPRRLFEPGRGGSRRSGAPDWQPGPTGSR